MCLAVPGKVESLHADGPLGAGGRVNFGGIVKDVCLAYVPEVQVGDYVIVHVGFALSKVDEAEANQIFEYLRQMDELAELDGDKTGPRPAGAAVDGSPAPPEPLPGGV